MLAYVSAPFAKMINVKLFDLVQIVYSSLRSREYARTSSFYIKQNSCSFICAERFTFNL